MFEEMSMFTWLSALAVFALGGAVGYLAARQTQSQRTRRMEEELSQIKLDHAAYRGQVERHFLKTSALFGKLTDNYREVYEHLAYGAQTLCKEKPSLSSLNLPRSTILSESQRVTLAEQAERAPQAKRLPDMYDAEEENPYRVREDEAEASLRNTKAAASMDETEATEAAPKTDVEAKSVIAGGAEAAAAETTAEGESPSEAEADTEIEEIHLGVESASGIDFSQTTDRRRKTPPFH